MACFTIAIIFATYPEACENLLLSGQLLKWLTNAYNCSYSGPLCSDEQTCKLLLGLLQIYVLQSTPTSSPLTMILSW